MGAPCETRRERRRPGGGKEAEGGRGSKEESEARGGKEAKGGRGAREAGKEVEEKKLKEDQKKKAKQEQERKLRDAGGRFRAPSMRAIAAEDPPANGSSLGPGQVVLRPVSKAWPGTQERRPSEAPPLPAPPAEPEADRRFDEWAGRRPVERPTTVWVSPRGGKLVPSIMGKFPEVVLEGADLVMFEIANPHGCGHPLYGLKAQGRDNCRHVQRLLANESFEDAEREILQRCEIEVSKP